ncbi:MAG: FHA domain-containing protein [Lachnospiraceae bacterium]|nr:FHA domain-containing protein [Lachnospiraceae bacterium]
MARVLEFCKNGHTYDPREHERCPYCYGEEANKQLDLTRGADDDEDEFTPTEAGGHKASATRGDSDAYDYDEEDRTESAYMKEKGMDPVVGWLVAVTGTLKGTDYRIHSDNNFIGRSRRMSICISGDDTISKENHAVISYDTRSKKFYFKPGTGKNLVRVNENAIFSITELKAYDIIELGVTKFVFIPFCGEGFDWDQTFEKEVE